MSESTEKDFFSILHRFKKLMMRIKLFGVSHGEFMMLGAIYSGGHGRFCEEKSENGIKISELTGLLKGSKSATSKMLRILEEKGYIERVSDEKDKRNVYVKLSEDGENALQKARNGMQKFSSTIMNRMGDEDLQHLIRLFDKLYHIIEDEINTMDSENKEKGNK